MIQLDPALFRPEAIEPETKALNARIIAALQAAPDKWTLDPAVVRAARAAGKGPFPLAPRDPRAEQLVIEGPHGPIPLHVIEPGEGPVPGVFLHFHGGGWTLGAATQQEQILTPLVDATGFAVVSVDYRLAPEHRYPQGPDDCEAAALWLARECGERFGTRCLAIGGESAGAHLAVVTLLRLRDRHGMTPFAGANLIAGCYDLGLTPSAAAYGETPLVLTTRDVRLFANSFLGVESNRHDPDISPLYADLKGLPPALFSVGSLDALLDDSLFMASRWLAAGNVADIDVTPGGAHVFQYFDSPATTRSLSLIAKFLTSLESAA
ncbi:Acetyl esterase [Hartmannibacter diazotrophicus]|uniref:Acetyl esterase n=1 Tax=Hartmannibacter diazotrophicus TaxID=1482074 RepID=A0A2C9DDJ6_9HYPH|nr:alpha/beta hydrolase [Hartmannibacter diazotrophicus]SON58323.1 Acetyl esterase [Hartmannibacter diazotrophicus]